MQHISEILPAVMHAIQHENWEQIITDVELQRMDNNPFRGQFTESEMI